MPTSKTVMEIIRQRRSCRSFDGRPLSAPDRAGLQAAIDSLGEPPFGSAVRLVLLDERKGNDGHSFNLGSYGTIRGARQFITGTASAAPGGLEDFGYQMESVILAATALGLGTCWLGGLFNQAGFASALTLTPGEVVPAVTPVGYAAGRQTATDRMLRWSAGSSNRLPWERLFFEQEFSRPLAPDAAGAYGPALDAVRLGPSASNRQPWRVVKDRERPVFHFYLQRNPVYGRAARWLLQTEDLQRLDLGIALCHFAQGCRELGLPGHWRESDPGRPVPARAVYGLTWSAG